MAKISLTKIQGQGQIAAKNTILECIDLLFGGLYVIFCFLRV